MQVVLEKVSHGCQFRLGEMAVHLGDFHQDMHKQINKLLVGLGLG